MKERVRYDSWCRKHQDFHENDGDATDRCEILTSDPELLKQELREDRAMGAFNPLVCREDDMYLFTDVCMICAGHETEHVGGRCLLSPTRLTLCA